MAFLHAEKGGRRGGKAVFPSGDPVPGWQCSGLVGSERRLGIACVKSGEPVRSPAASDQAGAAGAAVCCPCLAGGGEGRLHGCGPGIPAGQRPDVAAGNEVVGAYRLYALAGEFLPKLGIDDKELYVSPRDKEEKTTATR